MRRPKAKGRKDKRAPKDWRNQPRPRKPPLYGKTPQQFCDDHGFSISTLERMPNPPEFTQPSGKGGRRTISPEAEKRWLALNTKPAERTAETQRRAKLQSLQIST